MEKLIIYYSVQNGGDFAYPKFMESMAKWDQDHMDGRWGKLFSIKKC